MSIASVAIFVLSLAECPAQVDTLQKDTNTLKKGRLAIAITSEGVVAVGTLIGLSSLWYKDYPRSSFHFFNDNHEWLQMDKMGHFFTAYQLSRVGYGSLKWSGVKENRCAWYGGATGASYQLIIEVLDGLSAEWGFSWGDFTANMAGSILFTTQQLIWHEQRFWPKFSYHYTEYAAIRPELLGSNWAERLLKDYNGQTYWLSVSPGSFLKPEKKFPRWAAVSIGYSAEGMVVGDPDDLILHPEYMQYQRNRRFFLSLDVDFSKIPFKSKALRTLFSFVNTLKVPFPAIEYNTGRGFQGHWFYL